MKKWLDNWGIPLGFSFLGVVMEIAPIEKEPLVPLLFVPLILQIVFSFKR